MTRRNKMTKIPEIKTEIEEGVRELIENYQALYPDVEIHSILIYAKGNYVTKGVDYHVYADVRDKGQIFLGMSS
jgi:hypothetical protein